MAEAHGLNPTVYAAEALGLAMASAPFFNSYNGPLFAQSIGLTTGVSPDAVAGWFNNWKEFYAGPGANAHAGLTVEQAAAGATFGDAVGAGLLSSNPQDARWDANLWGRVANTLINTAEGITGEPQDGYYFHRPLQGELFVPSTTVVGIDATPIGIHELWAKVGDGIGGKAAYRGGA